MAFFLYVKGYSSETTLMDLIMYFQSKESGGGDIDDECCMFEKEEAKIAFDDEEDLQCVLKKDHVVKGITITISRAPFRTKVKASEPCSRFSKRNKIPSKPTHDKPIIGEIKTVIVTGISPATTDNALQWFFENKRRSGGGNVANLQRVEPEVAHVIFESAQVASRVLEKGNLEIDGYLLQLKAKKPEVTFPKDKKKLVETMKGFRSEACATIDDEKRVVVTGKKEKLVEVKTAHQRELNEMAKKKEMVTKQLSLDRHKLSLMFSLGFEERFESVSDVEVKIDPKNGTLTIKGSKELVDSARDQAYKEYSKIRKECIDLNKRQEDYLTSGGLEKVNDGLKKRKVNAMVFLDRSMSRKTIVELLNIEKFEEVKKYISEQVFEERFAMEEECLNLLRSEEWKAFQATVALDFGVNIYGIGHLQVDIWLTGEKSQVKKAHEELKHFVKVNTIMSESIVVDETTARHLSRFCVMKIKNIEVTLQSHMVKLKTEEGSFTVQGTKEGVKKAKDLLQETINDLVYRQIAVEKPGMQKYLVSEEGKTSLGGIETKYNCTISLSTERKKRSTQINSVLCSYETREEMVLKVYQADITTHPCDVIVNAANGDLQHIDGLAKMIVDKGGKEIQEDCDEYKRKKGKLYPGEYYKGIPGKLPCKHIIHTVAPQRDNSDRVRDRRYLKIACKNTLEAAKNHSSIGLPAVGCGVYGIPEGVWPNVVLDTAVKYSSRNGGKAALKENHFVNNDSTTANTFMEELREKFNDKPTIRSSRLSPRRFNQDEVPNKRQLESAEITSAKSSEAPTSRITTNTKTTISVVVGDLSTHPADVLVNTTNQNLEQDSNPSSLALSNKAGPVLQQQCSQVGMLKPGQITFTGGGNLLCKQVCHVLCTQWNKGEGERVLRSIIQDCLIKSQLRGMKSIAFPAIGTGTLGFPHDMTAKICFEESKEFSKKNPSSCLKDIRFVVYHQNQASVKAFNDELRRQPEWMETANEVRRRKEQRTPEMLYGGLTSRFLKSDSESTIAKQKLMLFLEIFTENKETSDLVVDHIACIMTEQLKTKSIENELIKKLPDILVTRIMDTGKENNVEVKIEKLTGRIIVHGHTEDVLTVISMIKSILNEVKLLEQAREIALRKNLEAKVDITVPDYWDPQPIGANGKKVPLHIVLLDRTKHREEYKKVRDLFLQTANRHTIQKIERIQNPSLFKLYLVKKQSMDEQNGSNEKLLFHGTAAKNVSDINQNGLNRSYNGANGSKYGKGIYFADNAKYSTSYTPADASGTRCMYVARVAVGQFTVGHSNMSVLPKKAGSVSYDSVVDNVANPSIYVMFCDHQYYPEHLITFC